MLNICGIVDIGVRRNQNEDKILINKKIYDIGEYEINADENNILVALADGMGGKDAGEIASELVLQEFSEIVDTINIKNYKQEIEKASVEASKKISERVLEDENIVDMGTTLTGAYICEDEIITFNMGDSRTYILKNGMLNQLTKDDSQVQMLIDMGVIEESERNFQENKNIINRFFSANTENNYPTIKEQMLKFQEGDIMLLCSDGLTDYLEIEKIEEELNSKEITLNEKIRNLINKAIENGSSDNISIILVEKKGK